MGCTASSTLEARLGKQHDELLSQMEELRALLASRPSVPLVSQRTWCPVGVPEAISAASAQKAAYSGEGAAGYDVFISHSKRFRATEDRAVWVADICELTGLVAFFDRSDLQEISEAMLREKLLASRVCVTVLDPMTFDSTWVCKENMWAANARIPIVPVYDADRFRWEGQLDKWAKLYPRLFRRQAVPVSKTQRHPSISGLLEAIHSGMEEQRKPPALQLGGEGSAHAGGARVGVGGSRGTDTAGALQSARAALLSRLDGAQPSLIVATFTCTHDAEQVSRAIQEMFPDVPMIGCTTCRGIVFDDTWLTYQQEYALGLWGIADDAGAYSVLHITERPPSLVGAVRFQLMQARKLREDTPNFVILLGSPGNEEMVIEGIRAGLGSEVPILGGSSADNSVAGMWRQIAKRGSRFAVEGPSVSSEGITIAIAWSSCQVATTLTSEFQRTVHCGKVTMVEQGNHGRTIREIDGQASRAVYEAWTKHDDGVTDILAQSSCMALAEPCGSEHVRAMHPAFLNAASGALTTFADAHEGMEVVLLTADPGSLAQGISKSVGSLLARAADSSSDSRTFSPDEIIGALMIFSAGLVMCLHDQMPLAAEEVAAVVGRRNVMGICCFGEQGMNHERRAIHGNLMFGCLLFSNRPLEAADPLMLAAEASGKPRSTAQGRAVSSAPGLRISRRASI